MVKLSLVRDNIVACRYELLVSFSLVALPRVGVNCLTEGNCSSISIDITTSRVQSKR